MVGFETTGLPGVNTTSQLLKHSSLASSQSTHAVHSTAGARNSKEVTTVATLLEEEAVAQQVGAAAKRETIRRL